MSVIEVEGLQKSFGRLQVLKDISFQVEQGDCVAIIGPSGSGKSTLLRCLIELETADGGSIRIHGQPLVERGIYAPAAKTRPIIARMGMVFQQFNLYPHLARSCAGAPWSCSTRWAWRRRRAAFPASFPAANSSGWPSPGP